MDDYDDYCDLIDDDEETVETFKNINEEYGTWLDWYEDAHDEEFFRPQWIWKYMRMPCLMRNKERSSLTKIL